MTESQGTLDPDLAPGGPAAPPGRATDPHVLHQNKPQGREGGGQVVPEATRARTPWGEGQGTFQKDTLWAAYLEVG